MPSSQVSLTVAGPVAIVSLGMGGTFFQALFIWCFGGYGNVGMGVRRTGDRDRWTTAGTALRRLDESFFVASALPTSTLVDGSAAAVTVARDVPDPRSAKPELIGFRFDLGHGL